jgi:prevent-host-death family protein
MTAVGVFEAKNKLSELVDRAERGEEVIITRRGRPVAKLGPLDETRDVEKARTAAKRIIELGQTMKLGPFEWEEWKKYRDTGRR